MQGFHIQAQPFQVEEDALEQFVVALAQRNEIGLVIVMSKPERDDVVNIKPVEFPAESTEWSSANCSRPCRMPTRATPSHPFGSAQVVVVAGATTEVTRGVGSVRNCASTDREYVAAEFAFALHATTSLVTFHGAISSATVSDCAQSCGKYRTALFTPHF
jgi:hypothetical protein|tara:strand:+ start:147 stop:626 length:480 start_codon:yes stop_codon:yes gene_type:complete